MGDPDAIEWHHPDSTMKDLCQQTPGVYVGQTWELLKETDTHWHGVLHYAQDNVKQEIAFALTDVKVEKREDAPINLSKHAGGLVVLALAEGAFRVVGSSPDPIDLSFFERHPDFVHQG